VRIQPLHAQLLVAPIPFGAESKAGLLIPEIARNNHPFRYADVVEVGVGRTNAEGKTVPLQCRVGDVVAFAKGAGLEIPIEDEKGERIMLLLDEKFVLGIVHDLKRSSGITGLDGKILAMTPTSLAKPDVGYENDEKTEIARRAGWLDKNVDGSDDHTNEAS
jgi:co-chaperonin GroES (HSP10)